MSTTDLMALPIRNFLERPLQLCIPLPANDEVFGVLCIGQGKGGDEIDPRDIEILETLARQVGPSLQNIWLFHSLQRRVEETALLQQQISTTREGERQRLARELHDTSIQDLVALNYNVSGLRDRLPETYDRDMANLRDTINDIMETLRSVCVDLRPPMLDDLGLDLAIQGLSRQLEEDTNIIVDLDAQEGDWHSLPSEVALCLYRVAQEALVNIRKHAEAENVSIILRDISRAEQFIVRLVIQDDGRGFTRPQSLGRLMIDSHFGLVGIREQVQALDGNMELESQVGQGTTLEITIPVETKAALDLARGA